MKFIILLHFKKYISTVSSFFFCREKKSNAKSLFGAFFLLKQCQEDKLEQNEFFLKSLDLFTIQLNFNRSFLLSFMRRTSCPVYHQPAVVMNKLLKSDKSLVTISRKENMPCLISSLSFLRSFIEINDRMNQVDIQK